MTDPILFISDFLPKPEADKHLHAMLHINWERRPDAPRAEYWSNDFDRPYTYGRGAGVRTYQASPMPYSVDRIREEILDTTGVYHHGCFCNRYDDARDWLGWHADDDPGIDHEDPISVVTLGQARPLQWRPISSPDTPTMLADTRTVLLTHGSLLVMRSGMQFTHQHRIPKASMVVGTRVSLTYRSLVRA